MLENMKFRSKIVLLPVSFAIAFTVVLFMVQFFNNKNETLLKQIEHGYSPYVELCYELEISITNIQRGMQDAVAATDVDKLSSTDTLSAEFAGLIENAITNVVAIDKSSIKENIYGSYFLPPDVIIKNGKRKMPNFLLWDAINTSLYFSGKLWPDFRTKDFKEAIKSFQKSL